MTYEFFSDLTKISSHVMLNMIMDTDLSSDFAKSVLATLRSARGDVRYKNVSSTP